jgi:hypothetical protein
MRFRPAPVGTARHQRGAALITSLVIVTVLTGAAVAILMASVGVTSRTNTTVVRSRALQLAESGVSEALANVGINVPIGAPTATQIGTAAAPRRKGTGSYWADITDQGDGTFLAVSTGRAGLYRRRIESVFAPRRSVFSYAVHAGNSSGDPAYSLELGGTGGQADQVTGDVYSGGNVDISGDASVSTVIDAAGTITGAPGNTNVYRTPPDIPGMNYPAIADFDVAALFAAGASAGTFAGSGTALQMPESSPAHIFRLNPDDRAGETSGTAKDDYFLEDPYSPIFDFTLREDGTEGHTISLSGIMGAPGVSGTDVIYFVDGNLWLHNLQFRGIRFASDASYQARVTFVASGNIYFSDDLELQDAAADGVAFIAMKDPSEPDSGNIYFGDSVYGTIRSMEAYMYAENDFFDNNLTGSASGIVSITGTMAAGNQVNIESDYIDAAGNPQHSKLEVTGDPRLTTGMLVLPGIPGFGVGTLGHEVVYWKELTPQ